MMARLPWRAHDQDKPPKFPIISLLAREPGGGEWLLCHRAPEHGRGAPVHSAASTGGKGPLVVRFDRAILAAGGTRQPAATGTAQLCLASAIATLLAANSRDGL